MTALGAVDELDQGDGLDDELDRHHGGRRLVIEGARAGGRAALARLELDDVDDR